jgi:hypothetical protein
MIRVFEHVHVIARDSNASVAYVAHTEDASADRFVNDRPRPQP